MLEIKTSINQKMDEKVDILIATYNTKIDYLRAQIDSILNQSYTSLNILISDDNSSNDEVKKVLTEYAQKDNRIQLFLQEKNMGYIKNFNFLLEQSKAKYIAFSDHDDIWYPNKIERCLQKLINENLDLVYCNSTQIDEEGRIIHNNYFSYKNVPLIHGKDKLAISRCIGIGCSQIITKYVRDNMIPFKEKVMAHDWLAAFIANEHNGMGYIEEPLFGYRLHNTNVFGGRSLQQNLTKWKEQNGKSYKAYLKYRNENVIDKAYLDGAKMCLEYSKMDENINFLNAIIRYYGSLKKSKYINFNIAQYFKFLRGANLLKKMIKEFIIFHIPIIGYLVYLK